MPAKKAPPQKGVAAPVLLDSVGFLLHKSANRLRERLDPLLAPYGLTGKLLSVLKVLDAEGSHTQQELSGLGCLDRSTVVVLIDALEQLGLVERGRKPGDRRAHVVELTPKGRRTLVLGREIEARTQDKFLACFDARERRILLTLLGRLVQAFSKEGL